MGSIIFLVIVLGLIAFVISLYNRLVSLRNRVRNGFSQIDVQLTRRYDLIPNLVESVKGYMAHEKDTLEAVIEARNSAMAGLKNVDPTDPTTIQALAAAETTLGGSLGKLFALVESYPDLKANENMLKLQEELSTTENKVAFARQAFNDAVMTYNTACESFPANIIAGVFRFNPSAFLEIESEEKRAVPDVSFT